MNSFLINKRFDDEDEMIHYMIYALFGVSIFEDTLLKNLLNWAFCEKKIVSIYFADSDMEVEGYLKNAQGSQIAQVDVYEAVFEAGNSFVDVTKAQYIHVDSKRARDAEIVLRYKENEQ